jgi:hypothetical protein
MLALPVLPSQSFSEFINKSLNSRPDGNEYSSKYHANTGFTSRNTRKPTIF